MLICNSCHMSMHDIATTLGHNHDQIYEEEFASWENVLNGKPVGSSILELLMQRAPFSQIQFDVLLGVVGAPRVSYGIFMSQFLYHWKTCAPEQRALAEAYLMGIPMKEKK